MLIAQGTHQFLARMLSENISSWRVRSVHAPVPDWYAPEHRSVPDAYAKRAHPFLTCMFSARISSWSYAQRAHKSRSMLGRNSIFSIIFKCWGSTKWTKLTKILSSDFTRSLCLKWIWVPIEILRLVNKKAFLICWMVTGTWFDL